MKLYKRPEKETDPSKLPGQIVNRVPSKEYKPAHGGYPGEVKKKSGPAGVKGTATSKDRALYDRMTDRYQRERTHGVKVHPEWCVCRTCCPAPRSAEQLEDGFPRWDEQGRRITAVEQAVDPEFPTFSKLGG